MCTNFFLIFLFFC